jgi:hypothetical protein
VVDALGPSAEDALEPLDAFLALNPAQSSVNLWLGQPGATTPCHYDSYHNFYAQLAGKKRFVLLPPADAAALHTFPFLHPSFAQCQARIPALTPRHLNWSNWRRECVATIASWSHWARLSLFSRGVGDDGGDTAAFPLRRAQPLPPLVSPAWVVDLVPGDVLYIPPFWLHEATALGSNPGPEAAPAQCGVESGPASVSVNVWTSDADSNVAEALFALPLPAFASEHAAGAAKVRTLKWSVLMCRFNRIVIISSSPHNSQATALVWAVLRRHYASEEGNDGQEGAASLLIRLANGRYAPLIEAGELPRPELGGDVCLAVGEPGGGGGALTATEASTREAYAAAAAHCMARLSPLGRGRQSPWLQNWVEMVVLKALPLEKVPSAIVELATCSLAS